MKKPDNVTDREWLAARRVVETRRQREEREQEEEVERRGKSGCAGGRNGPGIADQLFQVSTGLSYEQTYHPFFGRWSNKS